FLPYNRQFSIIIFLFPGASRMRDRVCLFAAIVLVSGICAGQRSHQPMRSPATASAHLSPAAIAAFQKFDPERIRAHVRFLSDDLLEGRGTGQRGGDIAAEYMATQLAIHGLKPAGDNGTYMQKVPMVGITPQPATTFVLVPAKGGANDLKPLDQYVAYDQTQQPQSDVNAEIVYVGYGIEAPEYNWDDYKGADVKGKVLLMLVNEPSSDDAKFFKGKALTYYGRWTYKYEQAARKGAVGAILIHRTDMASYPWEVVRNSNSGEKSFLKLDGTPKLKVASWIQLDVAKELAANSGMDLDKMMADAQSRDFRPIALSAKLKAHMVSKVRPFGSPEEVEVSGSERTTFYPIVQGLAKEFRLNIRPDARPEAGHYYRSDHFSLARVGIPAFSVNEGMKYKGHDVAWGMQQADEFTAKHYHQPSDEYLPEMDFTGDAAMARFGFALGWQAANMPNLVGWEKGDEFEAPRMKSMGGGQ